MRIQKNYRDFTVGELLDMGLEVIIHKHRVTEEQGKRITSMFEGTKQSTHEIDKNLKTVKSWKGEFKVTCFVREDEIS